VPRWNHPLRGIVEREALAAFAEDAGLSDELELWLLQQICATGRAWQKRLQRPFYLTLPILSRRQLASADFAARVQDELQRHGLPRAAVELEVSERLLSLELEAGGSGLEHLRSLGITLAVDRFGTGPSSLRLLRDAPLRSLRIAAELLEGVPGHDSRTRFARAFLRMARELKLRVVVDGVSRKEQLAFLRQERCDAASGLLCGDLLSLEACGRWLADDAPKLAERARDLIRPATLVR
jgi:EAL domain-containing protein (putative c-di-GMP-specific phosphodiesterase class I)